MSVYVAWSRFAGVAEAKGGGRSPLWELPTRSFSGTLAAKRCLSEFAAPWAEAAGALPQPSWATTKETAAWRFGA